MKIYKPHIEKLKENILNKEFYVFYTQLTSRGTKYLKNTGIFKVKIDCIVSSNIYTKYSFSIIENNTKFKDDDLLYLINQYHALSVDYLYETKEEAIKDYNKEVKSNSRNRKLNKEEKIKMLSLLIDAN